VLNNNDSGQNSFHMVLLESAAVELNIPCRDEAEN